MWFRTIYTGLAMLCTVLFFAPVDAFAHPGHTHSRNSQTAHFHQGMPAQGASAVAKWSARPANGVAVQVEVSAPGPAAGLGGGLDCGVAGCCGFVHCSSCGTAIPAVVWSGFRLATGKLVMNPDGLPPSSIAGESPPRPPRSFV